MYNHTCSRPVRAVLGLLAATAGLPLLPHSAHAVTAPPIDSGTGGANGRIVGRLMVPEIDGGKPIDVRSFRWGLFRPLPVTGKATFADLSAVKAVDRLSPALMVDTASGRHYTSVTLEVFVPGTTDVFLTYRLTDVIITAQTHADAGRPTDGLPLEELTFNYTRIEITVGAATGCWDVGSGKPC
jgi:hypothetical protein